MKKIIDSDHPDPSQFLLLRSRILERRGQVQEASQDVTKALELHQDPKVSSSHFTHLLRRIAGPLSLLFLFHIRFTDL